MPVISDVRHVMMVYDTDTMSLVLWDGALNAGAVSIGTVAQGAAGASAWLVSVSGTVTTKETRAATGTTTVVGDSATNVTLLAANANRLGATVWNTSSAILYLKCGATATTGSFTVAMAANSYFEVPFAYTGIIDGIWASDAGGNAVMTEMS